MLRDADNDGAHGGDRAGARYGDRRPRGRRGPSRRPAGTFLLLLLLPVLLLGAATPASAHAVLRATDPADGTVLRTAPRHVTLTFTESVGLLTDSFRVYDPGNRRVRTGPAGHAAGRSDTARVTLPARLAAGTYTVAWRVVSADSHPVSGALTFSVGKRTAAPAAPPQDRTENGATTALHTIARYLAYLSLALLLGTAAFVAYCRPPTTAHLRTPALAAAATLAASTLAVYLLRAPYEEAASPTTAFSLTALTHTATTRAGRLLLLRLALLLLAAAAVTLLRTRRVRLPRRTTLTTATALAVALALTWSASDHASAGIQVPAAIVSSTLHLLAMAAWLGGLAALLWTLRRAPEPAPTLPATVPARFSRLAFASVVVLVVTGVYQSWRGLGSWQALTDTTYGRTLLAKLAAVTALLLAAACSRTWTARLARPTGAAARARVPEPATGPPLPELPPEPPPAPPLHLLRRSVLLEAVAAALVLALTTLLTSTVPGRAATESGRPAPSAATGVQTASVTTIPFDTGAPGGHGKVQITLDPGRVGTNSLQAVIYGPDGGLSTVPELRVTLTLPSGRIGPLDTRLTDRGGYWATPAFTLPLPGTWTMKATVRVSDLDQVTVSAPVRVTR
ncbi:MULTISPECIES: copper resistance CopC family protein [Streptomyces]|uniref:Copper resistance protein CopC n=1 Tax=Streptomyces flaveolus TaxID=67297 RepID=A0ABV3A229_9ACTN|nr:MULTISPECIES: copper resistance CopC family protein [Streptomyces]KMS86850.1 transport integral membrane protein [Streptomyces regensis]KOG63726.1 transport integral membrane protein [Streptomyces antibioticus]